MDDAVVPCNMTFDPEAAAFAVEEHATAVLSHTVSCLEAGYRAIRIHVEDRAIAGVQPEERWSMMEASGNQTYEANVTGLAFGRTLLNFVIVSGNDSAHAPYRTSYQITVLRKPTSINLIFQIVLGVMILLYNFGFGCIVDHERVKDIVKRPVAPAIGACCQFLVMAPLSFGVAVALKLSSIMGLGLLAIGCSPGGGGSNVFAYLLNADLELSITLTFFSTLLALAMTPFWMWALGRYFYDDNARLRIPVANVFSSLAIVVIPVAAGVLLRHFHPKLADRFSWALKPFTAVIGVTFLGLGVYVYYYAFVRITWRLVVACTVVPFCGYVVGLGAGYVGRQSRKRSVTISLETGFQNLALALFMLQTSLDPPESDFAGVVPICYSFISAAFPALTFIGLYSVQVVQRLRGRNKSEDLPEYGDTSPTIQTISNDIQVAL